jgi:polyisoprenoid-binding protein YceI
MKNPMNTLAIATMAFIAVATVNLSAAVTSYELDRAHSEIGFSISHLGLSKVKGKFMDARATIQIDHDTISNSSFVGTIRVASVDTNNKRRDNHLKSADFFDVAKFPNIRFASKKVDQIGKKLLIVGDLTIKGVSKSVVLEGELKGPITDMDGKQRVGIDAMTKINRQDFGITWNKALDHGGLAVGNDVEIILSVEAVAK